MNHRIDLRVGWAIELDGEQDEVTLVSPSGRRSTFDVCEGESYLVADFIRAQQEQPVTDGDVD